MGSVLNLVIQEGGQEHRETDVGYTDTVPVNVIAQEGGIILTSSYKYAHKEGQNRTEWIKRCLVRQLIQILALSPELHKPF